MMLCKSRRSRLIAIRLPLNAGPVYVCQSVLPHLPNAHHAPQGVNKIIILFAGIGNGSTNGQSLKIHYEFKSIFERKKLYHPRNLYIFSEMRFVFVVSPMMTMTSNCANLIYGTTTLFTAQYKEYSDKRSTNKKAVNISLLSEIYWRSIFLHVPRTNIDQQCSLSLSHLQWIPPLSIYCRRE